MIVFKRSAGAVWLKKKKKKVFIPLFSARIKKLSLLALDKTRALLHL